MSENNDTIKKSDGAVNIIDKLIDLKGKQKTNQVRDLFDIVTESLKLAPVTPFRLTHPYRFKLGTDAVDHNKMLELDRSTSLQTNSDFTPRTRAALNDCEAFYFLGENISQQEIPSSSSYTSLATTFSDNQSPLLGRLPRTKSGDNFNLSVSIKPCMIRMPLGRSHTDLGDCFGAIPLYAWFLPYVLSCAPPSFIEILTKLPPLVRSASLSMDLLSPLFSSSPTAAPSDGVSSRPPQYSIQNEFYRKRNLPQPSRSRSFGSYEDAHGNTLGGAGEESASNKRPSDSSKSNVCPTSATSDALNTSWRSLGVLMLSKDPTYHSWESKRVCLLDNFLVELATDGSLVIGYTPLCGASVTRVSFNSAQHRRDKLWRHTHGSSSDLANLTDSQVTTSTALLVTCYTTSQISICPTASFYLTTLSAEDEATVLGRIELAIQSASSLSVSDVFDFGTQLQRLAAGSNGISTHDTDNNLLGRGRYAEVRLASRIADRDLFARNSSSVVHSSAKQDSGLQTPAHRDSSEDVPYVDHVRDRSSSLVSIPETCAMFDSSVERLNGGAGDGDSYPYSYPQHGGSHGGSLSGSYSGGYLEALSDPVIAGIAYRLKSEDEDTSPPGPTQRSTTEPESPVSEGSRSPRYNDSSDNDSSTSDEGDCDDLDDLDSPGPLQKYTGIVFPGVTSVTPTVITNTISNTSTASTTGAVNSSAIYRIREGNEDGEISAPGSQKYPGSTESVCGSDSQKESPVTQSSPVGFAVAEQDKCEAFDNFQGIDIDSTQASPTSKTHVPPSITTAVSPPSPPCAVKLVSKEIFWSRICKGQERTDSLVREVLSQALVSGLFGETNTQSSAVPIVRLLGVLETIDGFVMQLEVMDRRDLFDLLADEGPMDETNVKHVIAQLVEAVALCNRMGFAHRDVKLSNITFPEHSDTTKKDNLLTIKLADFGMAGFADGNGRLKGRCGTPGYVAPDILCAEKSQSYDLNVDMFSVGVAAYTLLVGYEPFYGADNKELMEANKHVAYEFARRDWRRVSEAAQDFIGNCLLERAEDRLMPHSALQHEWLRDSAVRYREQESSDTQMEGHVSGCSVS